MIRVPVQEEPSILILNIADLFVSQVVPFTIFARELRRSHASVPGPLLSEEPPLQAAKRSGKINQIKRFVMDGSYSSVELTRNHKSCKY